MSLIPIVAAGSLTDFTQHSLRAILFSVIFAVFSSACRQASQLDQIRQLFERKAPQNLDSLIPSME